MKPGKPEALAMAYNIKRKNEKMAHGGEIKPAQDESTEHYDSIADAILAKRRKAKMMAEGGEVDLMDNEEEAPADTMLDNEAAPFGEDILKENYQDEDVSMQSDEEADKNDRVSAIRKKMKSAK